MAYPITVRPEIAKKLGKKPLTLHEQYAGQVESPIERDGKVVQAGRKITDSADIVAYLLDAYKKYSTDIAEGSHAYWQGKTLEEVMYKFALPRHHMAAILGIGQIQAFASGDFSLLYRFLALYVRYIYACDIHAELIRGGGYACGTGTDHGTYQSTVLACFALMRPDWARCFFPKELGLVRKSHPTLARISNLIIGLLHDSAKWKETAYKDGRKFLSGNRAVSDRAVVSYLCNLYDANTEGMSADLDALMRNYRKAPWLMLPGGESTTISLFGLYLMGKFYLGEQDFAKLRRPDGAGWWDEYVDLCLQGPLPAEWSEPAVSFPEPLLFFNPALRWIEQGPPAGTICLAMDIKE